MESWPSPWPAQTGGNVRSANQRAALRPADQWGDRKCTLSVIVISVSTALWFPTSAPPSPPTSETRQKVCHHNFLFISVMIIDSLTQHHQFIRSSLSSAPLTWPRCRWGWGWSSRSSCRQWAHWYRQTPWLPPSRSTPTENNNQIFNLLRIYRHYGEFGNFFSEKKCPCTMWNSAIFFQKKLPIFGMVSLLVLIHTCLWMIFLLSWLTSFQPKCRTSPIYRIFVKYWGM